MYDRHVLIELVPESVYACTDVFFMRWALLGQPAARSDLSDNWRQGVARGKAIAVVGSSGSSSGDSDDGQRIRLILPQMLFE